MRRWVVSLLLAVGAASLAGGAGGGCARPRVVTITADPPDAIIRVDNRDRGRGPLTETFTFGAGVVAHTVSARRAGYNDNDVTITPDSPDAITIRLRPVGRPIVVRVTPPDAVVRIDGKVVPPSPSGDVRTTVDFPLDAAGRWVTRRLTVEHPKLKTFTQVLSHDRPQVEFPVNLESVKKDFWIITDPPDAEVSFDGEGYGISPLECRGFEFPIDEATGDHKKMRVRIEKAGFGPKEETISWDNGRENYAWTLDPQSKTVRIITEPPDAKVIFDGREVPLDDESGAHVLSQVEFPLREDGTPVHYVVVMSKRTDGGEWQDRTEKIHWDDGREDYKFALTEVLTRPVKMLRVRVAPGADGWTVSGDRSEPLATRDTGEGPDAPSPTQVTRLPEGTMVDAVAVAPDGSQVLFTVLPMTEAGADGGGAGGGELRSQIFTQPADGSAPEATPLTDGQSLDITPAYTPDGAQVVFASNRVGGKLRIWSMPASGGGAAEQLTADAESHDLWPSVDSSPKPRLFYQSLVSGRVDPRLFSVQIGAPAPLDLTPDGGGTQPRIGPKPDAVVFAAEDGPGGKRDLFRMPAEGGEPVNLTNTPEVDEFDPAWSSDGRRLAYASDAGRSAESPDNCDVFMLDLTREGAQPVRVTTNGSRDDSPAWDVRGRAIYFRSNRGGAWNVWRVEVK